MKLIDLCDEAFDLYKSDFALYVLIAAIIHLPIAIISSVFIAPHASFYINSLFSGDFSQFTSHMLSSAEDIAKTSVLASVGDTIIFIAICAGVSSRYLGVKPSFKECMTVGFAGFFPVTIFFLVWRAFTFFGLILCVIPGVVLFFIGFYYQFLVHAKIVEGEKNLFKAARRSWRLAKTNSQLVLGSTLLVIVLGIALYLALQFGLQFIAQTVIGQIISMTPALSNDPKVINFIVVAVIYLLLFPYYCTLTTLIYFNLRIQSEGFDMDLLAESLGYRQRQGRYAPVLHQRTPLPKRRKEKR